MSAIAAVSRQVKTMADGTLRLTVDIEPRYANDAFLLFGSPDVPMAVARLNQEASIQQAQQQTQQQTVQQDEKIHISGLALLAVTWGKDSDFWDFMNAEFQPDERIENEQACADYIKVICNIESRRDLMLNHEAQQIFHDEIRNPYRLWLQEKQDA
jgi:hypothetical protein